MLEKLDGVPKGPKCHVMEIQHTSYKPIEIVAAYEFPTPMVGVVGVMNVPIDDEYIDHAKRQIQANMAKYIANEIMFTRVPSAIGYSNPYEPVRLIGRLAIMPKQYLEDLHPSRI